MSTEEFSPRPWRVVDPHYEDAGIEIFDAEGARVCYDLIAADAALIVAAVNERDRLRAALERIVDLAPEYPAYGVDWNALAAEAFLVASSALNPARAVAGCGPCHGGRAAESPTPPREDER